ncbi:MAG: hypothetical protein PVI86_01895 [Phycisphaerae bacterium]|jgi:hypothetical protein
MSVRNLGWITLFVLPVVLVLTTAACNQNSLPSTVIIELPDGTEVEVTEGAGVASLADTTWQFYQSVNGARGAVFLKITFGPQGNLEGFKDNTIAPEIFGSEILFDGEKHATGLEGVSYAASTYGAETSDGTGFTFAGRMTAWFGPIVAGEATADATGNFDPDDPDTMTGTFAFSTDVSFFEIPEAELDEEFDFIATKIVDGGAAKLMRGTRTSK